MTPKFKLRIPLLPLGIGSTCPYAQRRRAIRGVTEEQQREARQILLKARETITTKELCRQMNISPGSMPGYLSGFVKVGKEAYRKIKDWEAKNADKISTTVV